MGACGRLGGLPNRLTSRLQRTAPHSACAVEKNTPGFLFFTNPAEKENELVKVNSHPHARCYCVSPAILQPSGHSPLNEAGIKKAASADLKYDYLYAELAIV